MFQGPQKVKYGKVGFSDTVISAKDIIIATGSVPFVPNGIEVDGKFRIPATISFLVKLYACTFGIDLIKWQKE